MDPINNKREEERKTIQAVEWVKKFGPYNLPNNGPFHFSDVYCDVEALVQIYGHITEGILDGLAPSQVIKMRECAERDFALLESARKFNSERLGDAEAKEQHAKIVADIRSACADSIDRLMVYIHHGTQKLQHLQKLESSLRQQLAKAESATKPLEEQVEEARGKIQSQIAQFWKMASSVKVSTQAAYFEAEGKKHIFASYFWMGAAFGAMLLLVAYALYGDELLPVDFSGKAGGALTYAITRAMFTRVLVFTVLGYALFFCARNYAAHRHNAIVNRHRQNALNTYTALVEANATPENRDIVLAQAARCIFAPQESGYARGGGTESGGMSVFETIRRGAGKSSSEGQ